jgi:hypothetical protein
MVTLMFVGDISIQVSFLSWLMHYVARPALELCGKDAKLVWRRE